MWSRGRAWPPGETALARRASSLASPLEAQGFVAAVQKLLDDVQVRCAALSLATHPRFKPIAFRRPGPRCFLLGSRQTIWLCHCDHSPELSLDGCVPYTETTLEGTWTHCQQGCGRNRLRDTSVL